VTRRQAEKDWYRPDREQLRIGEDVAVEPVPEEMWLPSIGAALSGSFHLATDEELAELAVGDTPGRTSPGVSSSGASAIPPTPNEGGTMSVAATAVEEKPATAKKSTKKSAIAGLSKTKLRAYLLSHVTVPDKAWNEAYGTPEREKGESRQQYVRRVLA
jgi:hypothetical protein